MSIEPATFLGYANDLPGEPDDLVWLARLLREMMAAVAAEEGDTFRKAGMVARLSGLFLRASRAAELKRENKELARRNAELEERLAAFEAATGERETTPEPARAATRSTVEPARDREVHLQVTVPGRHDPPATDDAELLPTLVIGPAPARARDSPAL
jgi:hypothetical protein